MLIYQAEKKICLSKDVDHCLKIVNLFKTTSTFVENLKLIGENFD